MLNRAELRKVADYLYDGEPRVAHLMSQIRQFKEGDHVLLWLCRAGLKGQKMVDFFHDEAGTDETRGVMLGVQKALDYVHGRRYSTEKLRSSDLK
jgi:hypothetical protein